MQSENYNKLKSIRYKVKNYKEFNQYMKSDKMPYIIYADIECLIKKLDVYANNPERYSATKTGEYIPCGYSMSTIWAFDHIENKHTLYRVEDCIEMFCYLYKRACCECN